VLAVSDRRYRQSVKQTATKKVTATASL
jgi:hypothetical protein